MNRVRKSNLLVIDEVGYLPVIATEGNLFFQLISELQEQTSIIITTIKGFEELAEFLNDPALATTILDRLSYRCDRIMMISNAHEFQPEDGSFSYYSMDKIHSALGIVCS